MKIVVKKGNIWQKGIKYDELLEYRNVMISYLHQRMKQKKNGVIF